MHVIRIHRRLVRSGLFVLQSVAFTWMLGQGMNASMNDSHNLGRRVFVSCSVLQLKNLIFISMETGPCFERLGKHVFVEDSMLTYLLERVVAEP